MMSTSELETNVFETLVENSFLSFSDAKLDVLFCNSLEIITNCSRDTILGRYYKLIGKNCSHHNPSKTKPYTIRKFMLKQADWDGFYYSRVEAYFNLNCYSSVDLRSNHWYNWLNAKINKYFPRVNKRLTAFEPRISNETSVMLN